MRATPSIPLRRATTLLSLSGWLLLAFALCVGNASAQVSGMRENRLESEILRPKTDIPFKDGKKGSHSIKTFDGATPAKTKSFSLLNLFKSKDFKTDGYKNANAWSGETAYKTSKADLRAKADAARLASSYDTKAAKVTSSRFADDSKQKNYASKEFAQASKTSSYRGSSQDKIDIHGPAAMASIDQGGSFNEIKTMDDVRNLLNELATPASRRTPR